MDTSYECPCRQKKDAVYQDGSAVKGESVRLYHSTRQGLLHNILKVGVQASIPSHKTEGLWAYTLHGCVLELQALLTLVFLEKVLSLG